MKQFRYLFIDFNAYFASVEQHDDPSLRGRPVLVAPLKSEYTSAIAVSYEARPFGIRRGTRVRDARHLCPDIAIRYARHDRYVQVHHDIMAELNRHLPLEKVYSVDEAAFKLSSREQTPAKARLLALTIKKELADNVGPALRSSIGIAPSPLLAKLAAESQKPDGLTILSTDELPHHFRDIQLTDIPGVGAGIYARLQRAGINTFEALWAISPKQARAIWGSVQGERFWYQFHGFETEDLPVTKSMIGHSRVLSKGYNHPDTARIVARALLLKAARRLRHHELYASAITLSIKQRNPNGDHYNREEASCRFNPAQDSFLFLTKLHILWDRILARLTHIAMCTHDRLSLSSVTIYLHDFSQRGDSKQAQGDLFEPVADRQKREQRARLWRAIDTLNADKDGRIAKLGHSKKLRKDQEPSLSRRHVMLARQQGLNLDYLGNKIAFSRVPDEEEFLH